MNHAHGAVRGARNNLDMPIPRAVAVVLDGPRALVIKRFLRHKSFDVCVMCANSGQPGPQCPGHHYAVLPGGHVEQDETAETAALRELREETTLEAQIDRLRWTGMHHDRPAFYFLMKDVTGTPTLSGPEAQSNRPNDSYELMWATANEFDGLNLHPADAREQLASLIEHC